MRAPETPPPALLGAIPLARWADLPVDLRDALEEHWRAASRAHRSLALSLDEFVADVLRLWARGKARLELRADADTLRGDLGRLHYADFYLARLCERGDESAWRAFSERYLPDLQRVLARRVERHQAEQVASAVIADMALPPTRKPDRTLLGTYEGSGPLWAWLATNGIRRVQKEGRKREAPLEAAGEPAAEAAAAPVELDAETERFLVALRSAWATLEPREALALRWKHRDGLSQREIARLLDASEPTVSRVANRATTKLKGGLAGLFPDLGPPDEGLWTRLEAALSHHFATLPPVPLRRVGET